MSKDKEGPFASLNDVEPQTVEWLMKPLIPYGMITIMEGDPGIGKSYLAMHIASVVSTGGNLADSMKISRGRVLYMSAEDDAAYTIRPRIDAMGGDVTRIRYQPNYVALDEEGLKALMHEIRTNPPSLIVIDPLYAYVPAGSDMYKPNVIRSLLSQLTEFAEYAGSAVLIVRHLTKSKSDKAIYQGVGSIDVIGAARSAILVAKHPDDPEVKVIAHVKYNLSEQGKSWQFELVLEKDKTLPILRWLGSTDLTPEDLLSTPNFDRPSALNEAIDFLRDYLVDGPESAEKVKTAASASSIASRTLDRAKDKIGVITKKQGKRWFWSLPD